MTKETPPPSGPEVLLAEVNPHGTLHVIVEANDSTVYMYLTGPEDSDFGMRSVWVRNLADAPDHLDKAAMQAGKPPMMPAAYCRQQEGLPRPSGADLEFVWLPEGNGVALYEKGELLAIIPPWSGTDGFDGYSRDARGQGPVAWELERDNVLIERFEEARTYWDAWDKGNPWETAQTNILGTYEKIFGKHSNYYATDGGEWPPRALVRFSGDNATILASIGVSLRPQPNVEMHAKEWADLRRIEIGVVLPASWSDDDVTRMARYLSGLSAYPWASFTWLGPGHTMPSDSWREKRYEFALFWPTHPALDSVELNPQFGDRTTVLWLIPITREERAKAEKVGSESLFESLPSGRWESG